MSSNMLPSVAAIYYLQGPMKILVFSKNCSINVRNGDFFSKSKMLYYSSLVVHQTSYISLHGKNIPKPQKHPEFDTKSPLRQNSFHTF